MSRIRIEVNSGKLINFNKIRKGTGVIFFYKTRTGSGVANIVFTNYAKLVNAFEKTKLEVLDVQTSDS